LLLLSSAGCGPPSLLLLLPELLDKSSRYDMCSFDERPSFL
jgi:hypothetical protein